MTPTRRAPEASFQSAVVAYAQLRGFRVVHFRPARTRHGWRTAILGDGAGFPDLLMVRPDGKGGRIIAAELKAGRGKLTPAQEEWLRVLKAAGVETYIWTPTAWPAIE